MLHLSTDLADSWGKRPVTNQITVAEMIVLQADSWCSVWCWFVSSKAGR